MAKNTETLATLLKEGNKTINSLDQTDSNIETAKTIIEKDFALYHIEELTYEKESPRKEALENIISTLSIDGINFVYLLIGDKTKVSFYFGIVKNHNDTNDLELDIDDIGKMILQPSINGNFRGSKTVLQNRKRRKDILDTVQNFSKVARIDGIPSVNSDNEEFQGIDRLADVMVGDEFSLMIVSDPLRKDEITKIENSLYEIHDKLTPLAKTSVQESSGDTITEGYTKGTSNSNTKGTNKGTSRTDTKGISIGTSASEGYSPSGGGNNSSKSTNDGSNENTSSGITDGSNQSTTQGESNSTNKSEAKNSGISKSKEFTNKVLSEWIEYIDETLLPRVEYGKNKGLFHFGIYIMANEKGVLLKLGNTIKSLFSGTDNNKAPLQITYLKNEKEINCIKNFQLPVFAKQYVGNEGQYRLLFSKARRKLSGWASTNELSVISSLPQKEVLGLALKEEVEFGLNVKNQNLTNENSLLLGNLVKSGNTLDIDISIDKKHLNKHIFIAGVTGSGKTTTCQRILNSANFPFMVIEPAKTEYRILTKTNDDITIFTLGDDSVAPFRVNPFEFLKGENITSRVDMIKANIEAAFDMEAAIPQIIEAALYGCYESYGWNIATSTNSRFEDPFADGVYSFPTLSDLIKQTEKVVENQGFDDRLKNDYLGSIKARLQGLLVGSKGFMLNTPRSIDFVDLLEKNVILELEELKNGAEKSLVMGFILISLNEALKQKYKKDKNFKHITLIEEAHRLLAKYTPGENPSKKLGVETFADMLAEVRKYGESLIIVDQIPNKLTPEVLKNTNTKIVHRLFASDDKEAIGNTMALEDEQKEFLSSLEVGRVIVSNQDFTKPIQVQIKELENISTTNEDEIDEDTIRNICLKYYQDDYKRGIIQGLEVYTEKPSLQEIENFLCIDFKELFNGWSKLFKAGDIHDNFKFELKDFIIKNNLSDKLDIVNTYLINQFYSTRGKDVQKIQQYLKVFLDEVLNDREIYNPKDQMYLTIK